MLKILNNHYPKHHDIKHYAHKLWEERNKPDGDDWNDWFKAETELITRYYNRIRLTSTKEEIAYLTPSIKL